MARWQYFAEPLRLVDTTEGKVLSRTRTVDLHTTKLDKLGQDGWEAVAFIPTDLKGAIGWVLLKRPVG